MPRQTVRRANLRVNKTIGKLDRVLSEYLALCKSNQIDDVDLQTLKHHGEDLIGVGQKGLELINQKLEALKED